MEAGGFCAGLSALVILINLYLYVFVYVWVHMHGRYVKGRGQSWVSILR